MGDERARGDERPSRKANSICLTCVASSDGDAESMVAAAPAALKPCIPPVVAEGPFPTTAEAEVARGPPSLWPCEGVRWMSGPRAKCPTLAALAAAIGPAGLLTLLPSAEVLLKDLGRRQSGSSEARSVAR